MSKNFPDLRKGQATESRCPKILYPAQVSFKNEGKTVTLLDKEIETFATSRHKIKEIQKDGPPREGK